MILILLWLISLASVVIYLVTWPAAKPWITRLAFDIPVLLLLIVAYVLLRPSTSPSAPRAAEIAQWQPYLSTIYVAAISILFLGIAGTIRHFIFRTQRVNSALLRP